MPNGSRSDPRGFSLVPRRGAVALATTVLGVILLLGFRTPDGIGLAGGAGSPPAAVGQPGSGTATPRPVAVGPRGQATQPPLPKSVSPAGTPAPTQPPAAAGGGFGQFTGQVIGTPYGQVQVEVTETKGAITDVQALQLPVDRRLSAQISQYVAPILRQEALQAQSASIDGVSGATYTSEGYRESLQSALDQAGS